jgi:hypothetical protein
MWQMMNVLYVVDRQDIAGEGLSPVFAEGETKVFQVTDPFPRAWFVSQTEVIPQEALAITRLGQDDFDLRRTAVLDQALKTPLAEPLAASVTITALTPTHLTALTETTGSHLLVFSQIYYPGWQARIDGRPVTLLRTNVVQQGLVVPPGNHTVELVFRPASFYLGLVISGAALLLCLGVGLAWFKVM